MNRGCSVLLVQYTITNYVKASSCPCMYMCIIMCYVFQSVAGLSTVSSALAVRHDVTCFTTQNPVEYHF